MDLPSPTSHKLKLTKVQETLLIPLYAKALDHRSKAPILNDAKADEIVRSIDYDFAKTGGFGDESLVVRAKHYDE
jgi:O-methyltransferase involved in polyketide biosynthesis